MDYKYIRAWGILLSSSDSFVKRSVERARRDSASQGAIYRRIAGEWATKDQCAPCVREDLEEIVRTRLKEN